MLDSILCIFAISSCKYFVLFLCFYICISVKNGQIMFFTRIHALLIFLCHFQVFRMRWYSRSSFDAIWDTWHPKKPEVGLNSLKLKNSYLNHIFTYLNGHFITSIFLDHSGDNLRHMTTHMINQIFTRSCNFFATLKS